MHNEAVELRGIWVDCRRCRFVHKRTLQRRWYENYYHKHDTAYEKRPFIQRCYLCVCHTGF
jgi:hypothetical protein